jgi:type IV secretion system protein VirD4
MDEEDFETKLSLELPRGLPTTAGQDRGVFARWLEPDELTGETWEAENGLLLGQRGGRLIGWNDNRHVMTIAGSRAGKGTSLIIPNLLTYDGSAFVLDPKGENAKITAGRRGEGTAEGGPGMGQDVYVLDPFGVSGRDCAHFNPLDELHVTEDNVIEDAGMFADALIINPDHGEQYWTESAQALMRALILAVVAERDGARRNLVTVRKLLMLTDERIKEKLRAKNAPETAEEALFEILMKQFGPHEEVCQGVGEQLRSMEGRERGAVLSTARTQTQWLDNERIRAIICESNFKIADLKRKKTTIYLCLPAMHLATHARWLRLMIMLAISVMERTRVKVQQPVLYVLDEFPVLGHMRSLESAAGLMAGFGVKLWTILQNVGQLKQHYKAWETFFANSGVVTAFGISDHETLTALSAKLGRMRMIERISTGTVGNALLSGNPAFKDDHFDVPLLAEHEISRIFRREAQRMLVLGAGRDPAVVERVEYFKDMMFNGLYDEPPEL